MSYQMYPLSPAASSTMQAIDQLADLPHELLFYQLAFFHDLSSHLAFSITCRRIHSLYDENLWRRISLSTGLGKPLDLTAGGVSWRQLCLTAVVHAKACRLSDCSEARLSRGRDRGLLEPQCNLLVSRDRVNAERIELQLSHVFEGLSGDLEDLHAAAIPCGPEPKSWVSRPLFQKSIPKTDLLYSIAMPATHGGEQMVTKLAHHFPASCALATVPAVDALELDIGPEIVRVQNRDGICVWDVVSALARKMFEVMPSTADADKARLRIYQVIASEWQQYVLLRLSLHGRGSINAHLDIGEDIFENYVSSAPP